MAGGNNIPLAFGLRGDVRRAWSISVARRPSGNTLAWPTYWPNVERYVERPDWANGGVEPFEFLGNVLLLPVRVFMVAPWARVEYDPMSKPGQEEIDYPADPATWQVKPGHAVVK